MGSERRRSPRMLIDPIRARVKGLETEVDIDEVGFGGFRVKSRVAFALNTDYELWVLPRAGDKTRRVQATAVRCRVISTDPDMLYEIGFAFAEGFRSGSGIKALIGSVESAQDPSRQQEVQVRVVPSTSR